MIKNVIFADQEEERAALIDKMVVNNLKVLPVVSKGELSGLVTRSSLMKALIDSGEIQIQSS